MLSVRPSNILVNQDFGRSPSFLKRIGASMKKGLCNTPDTKKRRPLRNKSLDSVSADNSTPNDTIALKDNTERISSTCFVAQLLPLPAEVQLIIEQIRFELINTAPTLAKDGTGGTYFLADVNKSNANLAKCPKWAAVFKPCDEEPASPNNPRRDVCDSLSLLGPSTSPGRQGVRAGEAAVREYAAYLLDHERSAGVPPTGLVYCRHPAFGATPLSLEKHQFKCGSLQQYIDHDSDASDMGPQRFSVHQVHRIGILDIRLCNCDRHGGNILVIEGEENDGVNSSETFPRLVPIDHGFCLPDRFDEVWFEWLSWPQANVPFDKDTKKYIAALDADKDIACLELYGLIASKNADTGTSTCVDMALMKIRAECLRVLKITTLFLKVCAKRDLTLFQIGRMMSRNEDMKKLSTLEELVGLAEQKANNVVSEKSSKAWEVVFFKKLTKLFEHAARHPPQIVGRRRYSC